MELKGLQLRDFDCFFWLSQRTILIAVNSGNGYKSIVLVVSTLFFLGQNPFLSDNYTVNNLRNTILYISCPTDQNQSRFWEATERCCRPNGGGPGTPVQSLLLISYFP